MRQQTKSKPLPKPIPKPVVKPRVFGDHCFDYIKSCTHDFHHDSNCPLCKLVVQSSRKYFEDEAKRNALAREQSLTNRAQMRLGLLTNWARCQHSFFADLESSPMLDLVLSKTLAELMIKQSEDAIKLDFTEIVKILNRKNRIFEVGDWAAVYLQCRIRRYLTQRYVRRLMLRRFEYVPSTKWKDEFYVDGYKAHKWQRYPHLIVKERPSSPRTVERRLNADNKKRETRYQRFQIAWNRCNDEEIFRQEQLIIRLLKQFVIFRDLVAIAMHKLHISLSPSQRMLNGSADNSTVLYGPVWVAMSAPASSARQVGISLALDVLPPVGSAADKKSKEKDDLAMDDGSIDMMGAEGLSNAAPASPSNPGTVRIPPVNYNRSLQLLESKGWDCLKCKTPEEVLSKLVCEEIVPSVESVLNISQDDRIIFRGDLEFVAPTHGPGNTPTHAAAGGGGLHLHSHTMAAPSHSHDPTGPYHAEVLPMCMQLRPFNVDKKPAGLFRLFFYEEEFIACSQVSPYVFYPEVLKHRDSIIATLKSYAAQPTTKALVKQYLHHVNVEYDKRKVATPSSAPGSAVGGRRSSVQQGGAKAPGAGVGGDRRMSSVSKTKMAAVTAVAHHKNNTFVSHHIPVVQSLFTPPQELIFDGTNPQLEELSDGFVVDWDQSDEKTVEISTKYKFLKGISMFQSKLKKSINAIKKKNAKKPPATTTTTTTTSDQPSEDSELLPKIQSQRPSKVEPENISVEESSHSSSTLPHLSDMHDTSPVGEEHLRVMRVMQSQLLGEEIYHLLQGKTTNDNKNTPAQPVKKGSALDSDSEEDEEDPETAELTTYAKKLLAYSTQVQSDIAHRIIVPSGVVEPNYHFQLMVIDVHITLPKAEKSRKTSNFMSSRSDPPPQAASSSNDANSITGSKKSTTTTAPEFPVEIHQITGMFPCHLDKSPPNLECGLFDWSYFHQMYLIRNGLHPTEPHKLGASTLGGKKMSAVSLAASMNSSTTSNLSIATGVTTKERMWTSTNPTTGVCAHKTMLPTGREFQFQMLAAAPSREHLDNELPKKIKVWLGMPINRR